VLLLSPTDQNKLLMQWKGPYTVFERVNAGTINYRIQLPDRKRFFHVNMLKKYVDRRAEADVDGNNNQILSAAAVDVRRRARCEIGFRIRRRRRRRHVG
jgi:hypothetical protein